MCRRVDIDWTSTLYKAVPTQSGKVSEPSAADVRDNYHAYGAVDPLQTVGGGVAQFISPDSTTLGV